MKRAAIGLALGLFLGAALPASGIPGGGSPRDAVCREVRTLGLEQYDRAFLALQDLLGHRPQRIQRATLRLQRIDDTWINFNELSATCARVAP